MKAELDQRRAPLSLDQLPASEQAILLCLLEAHTNSLRFRCDAWQFAVTLHELEHRDLGLTALHALLRLGLILHGIEGLDSDVADRNIQGVAHRRLSADSCFILADDCVHLAYALLGQRDPAAAPDRPGPGASALALALVPSFVTAQDGCRRLMFLGQLVRVFRAYAKRKRSSRLSRPSAGWAGLPIPCRALAASIPRPGCARRFAVSMKSKPPRSSAFMATAVARAFVGNPNNALQPRCSSRCTCATAALQPDR